MSITAKGSAKCLERPPCKKQDYYEIHAPCDEMKLTQLINKWVEPKICRDNVPGAVSLPTSSDRIPCPPCNPGMEYSNQSMCAFCEKDHYSDGSEPCRKCPPSTAPNYGLFFKWWPEIPPGMYSRCMTLEEGGCMSNVVWQPSGDHIHTTSGQSLDAYLILSLDVPGFRTKERVINGQSAEIGTISFTFELQCSQTCVFAFMMVWECEDLSILLKILQPSTHLKMKLKQNATRKIGKFVLKSLLKRVLL
ncbi:UPF0577 protein KIAA1324-like [Araneus ventricosus]|uniref:UPF0577 protein KIAA1324-like n=1 Tax=Araneus ventricosus TaxID=182803 RepID=A0A4Y2WEJ3_ARAVE|nr:UPF0577 protein KIAA1324-like [Araneus ventricosus]GBO34854.1 UPF0577 protein KIAA1324-like [Araneus ventricosus]